MPIKGCSTYEDSAKLCLKKLRDEHIIVEYSVNQGAKFQLSDDFYLSIGVSYEQIRCTLSSKWSFELNRKLKEFDIYDFITRLLY